SHAPLPPAGSPLQAWQSHDLLARDTHARDQRHDVRRQRREAREPVANLDAFAQELPRLFVAAARDALGHARSHCALEVPVLEVAGERPQRVLRGATTSQSAGGPVRVARRRSRPSPGAQTVGPLALRAGIVAGSGTPLAAPHATWVVAHWPPKE